MKGDPFANHKGNQFPLNVKF